MLYSYLILNTLNTGAYGKLIVTLDGDAKLCHSDLEGHYTLASTPVNGKQYWTHDQGSYAIWYDKDFRWLIGPKEHLGTELCWLHSINDTTRPEEATTWNYVYENDKWKLTSNIFGSSSMY